MSRKIPEMMRRAAAERAGSRCEYCRLPAVDSFYGFQIDHVVSRKHGGATVLGNLACACPDCNRNKGTDLGTLLVESTNLIRFFNPRLDDWDTHFEWAETGMIYARTNIGMATLKIFQFNHPDRIIERKLLWQLGLWP
jgi:hypothetical protein